MLEVTRWVVRSLFLLSSVALTGCSGDDDAPPQPKCPTTDTTAITVTEVAPVAGTSVANNMIVHNFRTVDVDAQFKQLAFSTLPNHTAGAIPAFSYTVTPLARTDGTTGQDYAYGFTIAWPTAPAHVAIESPAVYENEITGCNFALPSPLFEYDIVPP